MDCCMMKRAWLGFKEKQKNIIVISETGGTKKQAGSSSYRYVRTRSWVSWLQMLSKSVSMADYWLAIFDGASIQRSRKKRSRKTNGNGRNSITNIFVGLWLCCCICSYCWIYFSKASLVFLWCKRNLEFWSHWVIIGYIGWNSFPD